MRLDNHSNPYQQSYIRSQLKIHVNVSEIFLPEQHDGWGRIYHDTDINDTTGMCGQMQPQVKSTLWIYIYLHG